MELQEERVGDTCVVVATGRLDGSASGAFADRVGGLIDGANRKLLVDFAGVDFVSSAGLRAVLAMIKKVRAAGGAFALCGVQAHVREVLDIGGFTSMLSIHGGRADGLAALGGQVRTSP
jgi:stage II sporulation protein AA (anti-sigma F factor antagonist)